MTDTAPTIYASSNIASRMVGDLAEDAAIADMSEIFTFDRLKRAVLTVTADSGQRFKVTVQEL